MLICPNCGRALVRQDRTMRCENRHSFDIAASGYCNLLTTSRSGDKVGDAKEMVIARREFLDRGYYRRLSEAVCGRVQELCNGNELRAVDAGCGEGYYTREIAKTLDSGRTLSEMIGLDISKAATQYAAKRDRITQYITASSYNMPIEDHSADIIFSIFAPTPAEEFARVLKPDGAVLCVVPGEMHLWELKCAVYDTPYKNREEKHRLDGFRLDDIRHVEYKTEIDRPEDIRTLFAMTPYSHRTPAEGKKRLNELKALDVTLSFVLLTFRPE